MKSLRTRADSLRARDAQEHIVLPMDVAAIVLGIAVFAILLYLIEGIERV